VAILLVIVGILVFGAWFLGINQEEVEKEAIFTTEELDGRIYLSLVPNQEGFFQRIYYYDFQTEELHRFEGEFNSDQSPITHMITSVFSPNRDKIAFVGSRFDDQIANQVYLVNPDGSDVEPITNSASVKRNPDWSPDGNRLVFEVVPEGVGPDTILPEEWKIYLTDLEGNEVFVTNGLFPKFSPDGTKLLILKNDGLNLYDLQDPTFSSRELLVPISEGFSSGVMKLGLSNDRQMFAWTFPNERNVYVYRIHSWGLEEEPPSAALVTTLTSRAFWPVFSPDNQYLALEEIETSFERPALVVYKIATGERIKLYDLSNFYQESMWLNEWR
jgi:Tol biopolymer transport system component